ncbi:MAG: hypothetical protein JST40_06175 [Armatimonadetes bacterium]|nr:hypothetical protein [Armatimonadota bacterium]
MGSAYTPGLTVSGDIVVQKVRRLPIKGEVMVEKGQTVKPDTVVARAMLPGILQTIKLTERLGVEAKEIRNFFSQPEGSQITKGDLIAETKGFLGLFKQILHADYSGTIESVSEITGNVLVREAPIPVDMTAYIAGRVVDTMPEEGAIVETRGAVVQGIFGIGGERVGSIRTAVNSPSEVLDAHHIQDSDAGKILIGGACLTAAALAKAASCGVTGLVVGGIRDSDLVEFLGYDIGVAITGQELITLTVVVTEGFGTLAMANRTFDLLKSLEGKEASINGATQIRAGVIRPELIVPLDIQGDAHIATGGGGELTSGTPIRVIREPYFGRLGTVVELPAQLQVVESGTEVRVLMAKLDSGEVVCVPRANVEIIAT